MSDRGVFEYFAFGGCLRSELELPDLSPATCCPTPNWHVRISDTAPEESGELQGLNQFEPGWVLRLFQLSDGLRLEYGASGSYEIRSEGRDILWRRGTDRREEVARAVVLGPVMALALQESGILCLHGSAVTIAGAGIAFIASKGLGKSTLAIALAAAGGRLMSDDIVALRRSSPPQLLPGVHSVRMHAHMTDRVVEAFPDAVLRDGRKKTLTMLPPDRLGWQPALLSAIYVLHPPPEQGADSAVIRTRMQPLDAALALAAHTKLVDDLVGYAEAGRMLRWTAELASAIPVYRLTIRRDLTRLSETAQTILSWHG